MARRESEFLTIRSEGGLLPPDLLRRILDPAGKLDGTLPRDYSLPEGERLSEVITQSWNRLRKHWVEFRAALAGLAEGEAGTGLTNDKWSLPLLRELGFGLLPTTSGPELNGRTYAISRFFGPVPIHLVGAGLSLDRKAAGQRGAATSNPHGLVQEFLNRSPGHLWAIVGNGLRLRVLRDNQALSRQSFLEFDLAAMFDGEVYSDFVLLWLVAHATRFAPREGDRPDSCWLEAWTQEAGKQGTRALGDLRGGVERALQVLGEGFTGHPKNAVLRDALRKGEISLSDFHGQLLRVVYRLIFLFVAEDRVLEGRPLIHPRDESEAAKLARQRFADHYGTARLRHLAGSISGSRHTDLWRQFQLLVGALSGEAAFEDAREALALPALGSFLWRPDSTTALNSVDLTNHDLLEALRHLAYTRQGRALRPVDFRSLGAEELGGVYESLLALTPQISADGARFSFAEFAGNERKTSGSYYTADSLVQCLLDSALDPVVDEALRGKSGAEAEKAILSLKICDPAVGSGHFLVGAAHRLARHLARSRAQALGESEPAPFMYQHALRDVIGRCLYGVDINPMAAELCRVSLWLEALDPGRPLSFLDHHIRVGNSLLGATPQLVAAGLPDEAFSFVEGDDRRACVVLRKRNKAERKGFGPLFETHDAEAQAKLQQSAAALAALPDDRPEQVRAKESALKSYESSAEYRSKHTLADAWCAAFFVAKRFLEPGRDSSALALTQAHLLALAEGSQLPASLADEVSRIVRQFHFFHWHLNFPEVLADGGFDCVLGNPPWDEIQFEETSWFASRAQEIADAQNASEREAQISALAEQNPPLFEAYKAAVRTVDATKHFVTASGVYPEGASGKLNTSTLFVAHAMRFTRLDRGRLGLVVPTGIATDQGTTDVFEAVASTGRLLSLFDFINEQRLFPAVRPHQHFCLFTCGPPRRERGAAVAEFAAFLKLPADLQDEGHRYALTWDEIVALSPEAKALSLFPTREYAEVARLLFSRTPTMGSARGVEDWQPSFQQGTFNMATASAQFRTEAELRAEGYRVSGLEASKPGAPDFVPLFDAKMARQWEWRAAGLGFSGNQFRKVSKEASSWAQLNDPDFVPAFAYWVPKDAAETRLGEWVHPWVLGFKDVTGVTSTRLSAFAFVPRMGIGHVYPLLRVQGGPEGHAFMAAWLNSLLVEWVLRQRMHGLHLTWHLLSQVPVPTRMDVFDSCPWDGATSMASWVAPRVAELVCTSRHLAPLAEALTGAPGVYRYDEERRFTLRAELDAAMFALAGLRSGDASFVMESLDKIKSRDLQSYGSYRTMEHVSPILQDMLASAHTGAAYRSRLEPPPADARCYHLNDFQ